MVRTLDHDNRDVEFSVRPHPARLGWRVLRINYAGCPEHEERIARALEALVAPLADTAGEQAQPGPQRAAAVAR